MSRSLSLLFLFIPALLCAGGDTLDPATRKRKASDPYSLTLRQQLGSPGAKNLLMQYGALHNTELPCDFMSITLLTPSLEITPSLLYENNTIRAFFFSRAALRRNPGSTALFNVNTMAPMLLADFPWILVGSTFPSPLGGDPITVFKSFKTSVLSPKTLNALEERIDVIDLGNTSIGLVNGEVVERFARNTRQIRLHQNVSEFKRHINEITSFVGIIYGDEDAPVEIHVDNRDPAILSLFPTQG